MSIYINNTFLFTFLHFTWREELESISIGNITASDQGWTLAEAQESSVNVMISLIYSSFIHSSFNKTFLHLATLFQVLCWLWGFIDKQNKTQSTFSWRLQLSARIRHFSKN